VWLAVGAIRGFRCRRRSIRSAGNACAGTLALALRRQPERLRESDFLVDAIQAGVVARWERRTGSTREGLVLVPEDPRGRDRHAGQDELRPPDELDHDAVVALSDEDPLAQNRRAGGTRRDAVAGDAYRATESTLCR